MVYVGQHQRIDATRMGFDPADGRGRIWYYLALAVFLIGPALLALAIMGWLKAL